MDAHLETRAERPRQAIDPGYSALQPPTSSGMSVFRLFNAGHYKRDRTRDVSPDLHASERKLSLLGIGIYVHNIESEEFEAGNIIQTSCHILDPLRKGLTLRSLRVDISARNFFPFEICQQLSRCRKCHLLLPSAQLSHFFVCI